MLRQAWSLARQAARGWKEHRANRMAAAFAFYTLLSIAPALVLAIGVAGIFLDQAAVRQSVLDLGPHPSPPQTWERGPE